MAASPMMLPSADAGPPSFFALSWLLRHSDFPPQLFAAHYNIFIA